MVLVWGSCEYTQVALSLWAGMDQSFDSSGNGFDPSKMHPAIAAGLVNTSWIERACAKMLTQKFAARLFDGALPDPARHVNLDSSPHRALARQTGNRRTAVPKYLLDLVDAPNLNEPERPARLAACAQRRRAPCCS